MKDDTLRPELKRKVYDWMVSFHRLDPRHKILTFFNAVASEGADHMCSDCDIMDDPPMIHEKLTALEKKITEAFNNTSILSVWRPTSNDAMRQMMLGTAVGKGLDIKGKSALQGNLSGFVPFLQIHQDIDRKVVQPIPVHAAMRVYFSSQSARDAVVDRLRATAAEALDDSFWSSTTIATRLDGTATTLLSKEQKVSPAVGKGESSSPSSIPPTDSEKAVAGKTICPKRIPGFNVVMQKPGHAQQKHCTTENGAAGFVANLSTKLHHHQTKKNKNHPAGANYRNPQEAELEQENDAEEFLISNHHDDDDDEHDNDAATSSWIEQELNNNNNNLQSILFEGESDVDPRSSPVLAITPLDDYAPTTNHWGIQVSQRLFWHVFVTMQDITRSEEQDTGRPSTPGFQDANLYSLADGVEQLVQREQEQAAAKNNNNNPLLERLSIPFYDDRNKPKPLPVVLQMDQENPMSPQNLVMAYEEHGKVVPVVSDFDGFLLGWRREALWFGCSLPRDQEKLMTWSIDNIEKILDAPPSISTWTTQWLDILKQEKSKGFTVNIPPYGFGDPKSYAIMENAADRLSESGAVRHGSECFNYYFPQEIDDSFLVISDTLSPVPWKYVDVTELQEILSDCIDDGFMFPINPKWILCDPGWKKVYDKLMSSNALYADLSKDVWFPPHSGVRERIERIHTRHPYGFKRIGEQFTHRNMHSRESFRRNTAGGVMSGQAEAELAEVELKSLEKTRLPRRSSKYLQRANGSRSLADGDCLFDPELPATPSPTPRKGIFSRGLLGNNKGVSPALKSPLTRKSPLTTRKSHFRKAAASMS